METSSVVIIGAGQAGLAMSHQLTERGIEHQILESAERIGDSWRRRWDSLTLFTPAGFSSLPGLSFPDEPDHTPGKDAVADYLESYVRTFSLPVRLSTAVRAVRRAEEDGGFIIESSRGQIHAQQVVVATGPFQEAYRPAWSATIDSSVTQIHSSEYRNLEGLPEGEVLVVGGGNSGVQLAAEIAHVRPTSLSVGDKLHRLPERWLGRSIFWWLERAGAMNVPVTSRLGRRASAKEMLIGDTPEMVSRATGVRILGRTVAADGARVVTRDGLRVEPSAIVWATGFRTNFGWIDLPVFDTVGRLRQLRGVTPVEGFYFLGLPWLHTRGSALLGWVGRDAAFLSSEIERQAAGSVSARSLMAAA